MARKSKVKNKSRTVNNLSQLIECRAKKVTKKTNAADDALLKQFSDVLQRFQAPVISKKRTHEEAVHQQVEVKEKVESPKDEISKSRLRKLNKPSLIDLKSIVTHPEVIEWFDCDAPFPQLNTIMKSSKNVVPVPSHWQLKREYLSGRSLLNKKPFELPDIMKQTNIEEMRSTLPEAEDQVEESLKETSRARVQPKLGTLDIDFKKLYDIFFKLGATWKPDLLLSFGDLYYENRNLTDESQWRTMKKSVRPGKLSSGLREALGLQPGQLPPWCSKMQKLGMPPSYPGMKVAGLNWDIQYLKGDIYGKVPRATKEKRGRTQNFGQILNFEEESSDEDEPEEPEQSEEDTKELQDEMREAITEIEVAKHDKKLSETTENDEGKQLYTVLKETTTQSSLGTTKAYAIPGHSNEEPVLKTSQKLEDGAQESEDEDEDDLKKFKF